MNELALFAGAGGGLLASELLGLRTICAVEHEEIARRILVARQNDGGLRTFPIWDDVCTFDGKQWAGIVGLVSGGFPCQAYSTAASGKNNADDLWPEMQRIVADVAPWYVFAENVSKAAINSACDDLESMGYQTKAISLSAKDLGADHIRERYWLLAHADNKGELLRHINAKAQKLPSLAASFWSSSPNTSGISDGVSSRVDRFKATGNAQLPIVAATAMYELAKSIA